MLFLTWSSPCLWSLFAQFEFDRDEIEQEQSDEEDDEVPMPSTSEVYNFLKQKFPEAYRELMMARDEDSVKEFQAALSRAAEFVAEYLDIARDDKIGANYFLEIERSRLKAFTLADQYFAANNESNRNRWLTALRSAAVKLFELQIKEQEHELAVLTKEVKTIGALIQERKMNRTDEINEILMEFIEIDEEDDEEED